MICHSQRSNQLWLKPSKRSLEDRRTILSFIHSFWKYLLTLQYFSHITFAETIALHKKDQLSILIRQLLLATVDKLPQEKDKLGKVSEGLHIRMEEKRENSGGWKLKEGSHSAPQG